MKIIKVYTDGASRGNPGRAAYGILVTDENDTVILTSKKFIGETTNNFAEYTALIESVRLIKTLGDFDEINFFCDSELVVKQITGKYKIKQKDMISLSLMFWKEIERLNKKFSITYIPREKNKIADRLANEALDEYSGNEVEKRLLID